MAHLVESGGDHKHWGPERVEAPETPSDTCFLGDAVSKSTRLFLLVISLGSKSLPELMKLEVKIERLPGLDEDETAELARVATEKDWEAFEVVDFGDLGVYSVLSAEDVTSDKLDSDFCSLSLCSAFGC